MKLSLSILFALLLVNVHANWLDAEPMADSIVEMQTYGLGGNIFQKWGSNAADDACRTFKKLSEINRIGYPDIDNISFQLRTPCGSKAVSVNDAAKLREWPEFDMNKKLVVFVTGWITTPEYDYVDQMAKAYHCRGGYNFLVVNNAGYNWQEYIKSAYNTEILGKFIAEGLKNLNMPAENIHLIGHSLGAQIVGSAGREFYRLTDKKVARITGLDPARPCFSTPSVFPRLGQDDAEFVDVIHTNSGCYGTEENLGHVDHFPTGLNSNQAGCVSMPAISHHRAIAFYIESIHRGKELNFIGKLCSNESELKRERCDGPENPMGFAVDESVKGVFFLKVNSFSPYGKNDDHVVHKDSQCGKCLKYSIH